MRITPKIAAIVVIGIIAVAGVSYAVYTSTSPSGNSCAGTSTAPTVGNDSESASGFPDSGRTSNGGASLVAPGAADPPPQAKSRSPSASGPIVQVVAAENFWGSLVSQLGGNDTSVLSIVSDPNADPHEYEANATAATAIADAQLVIVNGVGYDEWALQLIAAADRQNQVVLNVGDLNDVAVSGGIVTGNPHLWYNPVYVNRTVAAMYSDLVAIAPGDTSYFQAQYAALNGSLGALYGEAGAIRSQFAGAEVASTESIFVYLANYTDLDLVSPPAFMEAVAEGNDPPAQSVVAFQCQLESGNVRVLVYNEQTVTPITTQMKAIAAANNVTVVGITETIQPPGEEFEVWMNAEYLALANALNSKTLGQ
jgi:zinc/manganese transport system substrate-binding protein